MKFFANWSFNLRLNVLLVITISVLFALLSVFIYRYESRHINHNVDQAMSDHLNNLSNLLLVEANSRNGQVDMGRQIDSYYSRRIDSLRQSSVKATVPIDTIFRENDTITRWLASIALDSVFNISQHFDSSFVDTLLTATLSKQYDQVRSLVLDQKYFESGYAYLVHKSGQLIIHPDSEGKDISKSTAFSTMIKTTDNKGKFTYIWPENDNGKPRLHYFRYIEPYEAYLVITFYRAEMLSNSYGIFWYIAIAYILVLGISLLLTNLINRRMSKGRHHLHQTIAEMAKGHLVAESQYRKGNEIADIGQTLNVLIAGLRNTAEFAREIGKGELQTEFTPLSNKDVLGNSLLEMRQSLINAQEEEKTRRQEDERQKWITNGLAQFGDILRKDNDNMERLSLNIISHLVNYLDATQGGLFVVNEEDQNNKHLDLKAAFAFNRQKYIKNQLDWGEGLVGRCALEKSTTHLKVLPDDYVDVKMGLGSLKAQEALLVPLKMNDEVYGVIELASFNEFQPYQIEFIEKIAENIASTISVVKINVRTAMLLKESEEQAKILEQKDEEMQQNLEELRATQEEAARNEEAAMGFVNAVNHTIIRADYNTDGIITYANTKFLNTMGYSQPEIESKHYSMFVQEEDLPAFTEAWKRLSSGGKHYEQEVEYKTKNGKIWLLATYTAVRNNKGQVVKILYLAINISKEKQRNIAYANDIKAIDSSILKSEFHPDGSLIYDNNVLLDCLNYHHGSHPVQNVFDRVDQQYADKLKTVWTQVLNGIATEHEALIKTSNGQDKWFKGTYTPVKNADNEIYKILYIANDITDQKLMELEMQEQNTALREQQEKNQNSMAEMERLYQEMETQKVEMEGLIQAIDQSTFAIEHDLNGYITRVNNPFAKTFGLRPEDLIGHNAKEYEDLSSEEKIKNYEQFWNEIKFGLVKTRINSMSINGKEVWLSETYTPILDKDKNPYKILKIATDVSETKQWEIEAQKHNETLQQQQEELRMNLEEIQTINEEMERKETEMQGLLQAIDASTFTMEYNLEGKILNINDAYTKNLNLSKEETIGKYEHNFVKLKTPQERESYENDWQKIRRGEITRRINRLSINGQGVWMSETYTPIYNTEERIAKILKISTDITKTKQLEIEAKQQNALLEAQKEQMQENFEELQHAKDQADLLKEEDARRNKEMMETIERNRKLLTKILDHVPEKIFLKDHEGKMVLVNSQVAKVHNCSPDELIGKSDYDFFDADKARELFREEEEIKAKGGGTWIQEETLSGKLRILQTTKMPFYIDSIGETGILGVQSDITDIKQMEEQAKQQAAELREQEEELRQNLEELKTTQEEMQRMKEEEARQQAEMMAEIDTHKKMLMKIIDSVPGKIFLKDHEGKMILVNNQVAKAHGISAEELIGKSDYDFFDHEKARLLIEEEEEIKRKGGGTWEQEETLSGEHRILQTTKLPFYIDYLDVTGILGVQTDITELKKLEEQAKKQSQELAVQEEELRQNLEELKTIQDDIQHKNEELEAAQEKLAEEKALLDALLDNIPDAIYFKDRQSRFIRASQAMAKLFKVDKIQAIIGKTDFDFFGREHAQKAFNDEQYIIATEQPLINVVEKETHNDGRITWVSTTKMPLKNKAGETVGTFGISRDITTIKEMELKNQQNMEELKAHEEELRQNLEELEATQNELERIKIEEAKHHQELIGQMEAHKKMLIKVLDNVPAKIFLKDAEGKIVLANSAVAKVYNKTVEELIGTSDFDNESPELAKEYFKKEQAIIKGNKPETYLQDETLLGERHILQTTKMPFYIAHKDQTGLLGVQVDITELKILEAEARQQAEELKTQGEEMRQNLEELQATQDEMERLKRVEAERMEEMLDQIEDHRETLMQIIDELPEKVFLKDDEGKYVMVNSKVAEVFNLTPEEIIGQTIHDFYDKERANAIWRTEQEIMKRGRRTSIDEEITSTGEKQIWETIKIPFYIPYLHKEGLLGIQTDITEHENTLVELRQKAELIENLQKQLDELKH